MNFDNFCKVFDENLEKINIKIDIDKKEKYFYYMKQLLEWNEKINLTSIKDEKEFIVKHYIDSLTIVKEINEEDKVLDLGTGGGFPGIPLKLFYEKLDIFLLDSVKKKLDVIRNITDEMQIDKITFLHDRAENIRTGLEI